MEVFERAGFNQLPARAQVLWCHLAFHADERGVVDNAHEIRMAVGAEAEDVRALLQSGYVEQTSAGEIRIMCGDSPRPRFRRENGVLYLYTEDVTAMPHGLWHPGWVQV